MFVFRLVLLQARVVNILDKMDSNSKQTRKEVLKAQIEVNVPRVWDELSCPPTRCTYLFVLFILAITPRRVETRLLIALNARLCQPLLAPRKPST